MHIGDRIRFAPGPVCANLGVSRDQIGVVKDIDATCQRTSVMISFPEVDVYTSALSEIDVEIVGSAEDATASDETALAQGRLRRLTPQK